MNFLIVHGLKVFEFFVLLIFLNRESVRKGPFLVFVLGAIFIFIDDYWQTEDRANEETRDYHCLKIIAKNKYLFNDRR